MALGYYILIVILCIQILAIVLGILTWYYEVYSQMFGIIVSEVGDDLRDLIKTAEDLKKDCNEANVEEG